MPTPLPELLPASTIIPVVTVDAVQDAIAVARALQSAGLNTMEITLRRPGAWQAAAAVREAFPDLLLGIGTVTATEQLERAIATGANFAVSPGFSATLARAARDLDLSYLPGIATAGELIEATALGYVAVKVFPAEQLGGPANLRRLNKLFPNVSFCPTGGIGADDLRDYLTVPGVFAVGGSWLAPASLIAARDWPGIEARAEQALLVCEATHNDPTERDR
jgi:2-dehydro-3-deoxyphosphogluconate aldolase/(4S)-4-hydroxy-2-oxoglutarate aldolase